MKNDRRFDIAVLLIMPLLAAASSIVFKVNYIWSIFMFFLAPAAYLSFRYPVYIRKSLVFALFFGVPMAFWVDFIMSYTNSWQVIKSVFDPFRIFGFIVIENIIWAVLYLYLIVMFYESFFDKHKDTEYYRPRLKFAILFYFVLVTLTTLAYFFYPNLIHIDYFYFKFAFTLGLVPVCYMLIRHETLREKFFKTGLYFIYASLLYEFAALKLNLWIFPGIKQYVYTFSFFGYLVPLEEFLFWIILGSLVYLSYYEFFDDDRK